MSVQKVMGRYMKMNKVKLYLDIIQEALSIRKTFSYQDYHELLTKIKNGISDPDALKCMLATGLGTPFQLVIAKKLSEYA
jgi:hypothetical protein